MLPLSLPDGSSLILSLCSAGDPDLAGGIGALGAVHDGSAVHANLPRRLCSG